MTSTYFKKIEENRKVGEILSLKTNPSPIPGKILDSSVYV